MHTGVILHENIIPWAEQALAQQTAGGTGDKRG